MLNQALPALTIILPFFLRAMPRRAFQGGHVAVANTRPRSTCVMSASIRAGVQVLYAWGDSDPHSGTPFSYYPRMRVPNMVGCNSECDSRMSLDSRIAGPLGTDGARSSLQLVPWHSTSSTGCERSCTGGQFGSSPGDLTPGRTSQQG